MTSQFDFTNSEWSDIAVLPVLVGFAVAKAEANGPFGSFREIRTLIHHIAAEAPSNPAQGLIDAASIIDVQAKVDEFSDSDAELLGEFAVTACREISRVLDEKAEPDEAAAYKAWVLKIGHEVAATAKADGVRVSAPEAALLDRAKVALGIS